MMTDIVWHDHNVSRKDREELLSQKAKCIWFTGLSGSGKSTIANALSAKLHKKGKLCYILDGDNVRHGLNNDLSFSQEDRKENIRRVSEVAKLFVDSGVIVIIAFISPFRQDRQQARELIGDDFIEAYVSCPLEECEKRDPKGMYKKARNGEIKDFTGIHQKYDEPINPEIVVDSSQNNVDESSDFILEYITKSQNIYK